MGPPG